ncbi:MAG: xylulokinase [Streptococcaceae bacterium]|jgi:xylulokinase|nr:xylulokinase [Streptococcaceae bacterium]
MSYVLGLDLGTSSLKGLLLNKAGKVVAQATHEYPLETPQSGYSEQSPAHWLIAAQKVIENITEQVPMIKEELEGISFSGQMHSLVLLDAAGTPLRNAILWNDVRTTAQCKEIMAKAGNELLAITKNVALEGFTLPKILWVQEQEPDVWQSAKKFLLPKDYLAYWLTGQYHMDYSDAAGTLLLDVEKKVWSKKISALFDIPSELYPELIASDGCRGVVRENLKNEFGFINDVKVFGGGADNACAALGAGIVDESVGMVSIGTSGVFLSYEETAQKDYQGKLHIFNHVAPNAYYSMGVTLAAGDSLSWFKDTFAPDSSFSDLLIDVRTVNVGADGLLFTPYIVGERTPYVDGEIRGSFIGCDTQHELKHFVRAVLEGITFSLKDSQRITEVIAGKKFDKIISVGGGAKSADWLQIQADIFNAKIVILKAEQGPGLGAAMLAAMGLGWFDSYEQCIAAFVEYKDSYSPIPENVKNYQEIYEIYRKVYRQTNEICHELLAQQSKKQKVFV